MSNIFEPKFCVQTNQEHENQTGVTSMPTNGISTPIKVPDLLPEDKLKLEVKRKEKLVRSQLDLELGKVQREAAKLTKVQQMLEGLEQEQRKDIDLLRVRIEASERSVSQSRDNFKRIEKQYYAAKQEYEDKTEEKEKLTEYLRMMIFNHEKKKQEKLEELMKELGINQQSTAGGFKGF